MKKNLPLVLALATSAIPSFAAGPTENPKNNGKQQILVKAKITRESKDAKEIVMRPAIITTAGKPALVTVTEKNGNTTTLEITVTLLPAKSKE